MSQQFDGSSFVEVADLLCREQEEEVLRTSVGRSYYAAFWKAREYACDREGPLRSQPFNRQGAHTEVRQYFERVAPLDRRFRQVAYDLQDLINARHSVDYDRTYGPINCSLSKDAPFLVRLARNLITKIDQLPR